MQRNQLATIMVMIATVFLFGCGVTVESSTDDSESIILPRETVEYHIQRIDDYGYVEQQVSTGCIYLAAGEEKSVVVEDDEILAEYEFLYRIRGEHLVVAIKEDGSSLHRSYHRADLFSGGYTATSMNMGTKREGGPRSDVRGQRAFRFSRSRATALSIASIQSIYSEISAPRHAPWKRYKKRLCNNSC